MKFCIDAGRDEVAVAIMALMAPMAWVRSKNGNKGMCGCGTAALRGMSWSFDFQNFHYALLRKLGGWQGKSFSPWVQAVHLSVTQVSL